MNINQHLQPKLRIMPKGPKVVPLSLLRRIFLIFFSHPEAAEQGREQQISSYDVNFLANRLRKMQNFQYVRVYKFFLSLLFACVSESEKPDDVMGGRLKRTTLEGNMFCACVTGISESVEQEAKKNVQHFEFSRKRRNKKSES